MMVLFIFGLFVGSFLLVVADRIARNEPFLLNRSYCEKCKHRLSWFDLIPLFSFISLYGRCRYCKTKLSLSYPLAELLTGVLFVVTYVYIDEGIGNQELGIRNFLSFLYYFYIVASLIVIFFADLKYGIIPDKIVYPAIVISTLYLILYTSYPLPYLLSALGAFLFFFFLYLVTKSKGMGFGDVKYVFLMGLILGFPGTIVALYFAFLTGAAVSIILMIVAKMTLKNTIPFGPFLVAGTIFALFFGDAIVRQLPWF